MNYKFSLIALFFLYVEIHAAPDFIPNSCGDRAKFGRNWIFLCFPNADKTLSVVFDCKLNDNQDVHLKLWHPFFPPEMTSLLIQNCVNLSLTLDREPVKYFQLRRFHAMNISQLTLDKNDNRRCLPPDVVFENIGSAEFFTPLVSDHEICSKNNYILESLRLINVTIKALNSSFIWKQDTKSTSLKKFKMENVKIEKVQNGSININDKQCTVEIINSTVQNVFGNFLFAEALKVVISKNKFANFFNEQTLIIRAKQARFDGNEVDLLSENTLKILSDDIEITNNVFYHMEENAFKNVLFTNDKPGPAALKIYDFSNNKIYSLAPKSLTDPFGNSNPKNFENFFIFNNSVNCICSNLRWFDMVAKNPNPFHNKWSDKNNLNKCLNIQNCDVNQVLKNYLELCTGNYKCPGSNTTPRDNLNVNDRILINFDKDLVKKNENLNPIEKLLVNLEKNNDESYRKNSDLIKSLWEETKKIKRFF